MQIEPQLPINELRDLPEGEFWYIASPYSKYPGTGIVGKILSHMVRVHVYPRLARRVLLWLAFIEASKVSCELVRKRIPVYCPIAHTHPLAIFGKADPLDHKVWLPADLPMMKSAHGLIVVKMPGWDESYGIAQEVDEFVVAGKPVLYLGWPV